MKKTLILAIIYFSASFSNAQTCPTPSKSLKSGKVYITAGKSTGVVDKNFLSITQIKIPESGIDVGKQKNSLSCKYNIPKGAIIKYITIKEIIGLPKGLVWSTSNPNNTFNGGDIGCVFVKGKSTEKGVFPVEIKTSGEGSFFGMTQANDCTIKNKMLTITIK